MVQRWWRIVFQVLPDFLKALLCCFGAGISIGRYTDGDGRKRDAVVIV